MSTPDPWISEAACSNPSPDPNDSSTQHQPASDQLANSRPFTAFGSRASSPGSSWGSGGLSWQVVYLPSGNGPTRWREGSDVGSGPTMWREGSGADAGFDAHPARTRTSTNASRRSALLSTPSACRSSLRNDYGWQRPSRM